MALAKNIWVDAFVKYDNVAFDVRGGTWTGSKRLKRKHLFAIEPHTITTPNWILENINKYETFITWNRKFVENYGNRIKAKIIVLEGGVLTDNIPDTSIPGSFTPYDKKIKGIVVVGKKGHRSGPGCIYFLKEELLNGIDKCSFLKTHIFAPKPYGGKHYRGVIPGGPWGREAVEVVDKYLFNFCPENTYHPLWSWGYLCEKIFRSFKAKTVPIYLGCYNVEEYIPKELFIDLRDFYDNKTFNPHKSDTNYGGLAEYLVNFPREKYIEMTDKAFEWQKKYGRSQYNKFIKVLEGLD